MTDALVEAVARAMLESDVRYTSPSWSDDDVALHVSSLSKRNKRNKRRATAALQAIEAAGYRVVPVEATDRMSEACWRKASDVGNGKLGADQELWSAMLSAAPRVGEG